MLVFFHEYRVDHPGFSSHARVSYILAMVVPLCALVIADAIGWWNPWLWSGTGVGIALALMLASVVAMHRRPAALSGAGRRMIEQSPKWFPFFFVIIQSAIASLIVLFIWFSATHMALPMPAYVHVVVIAMAVLIPVRRYITARILPGASYKYEKWREQVRGVWHTLVTILITRVIIGLTNPESMDFTQGVLAWQTMVWVPAVAYIIFVLSVTYEHVRRIKISHPAPGRRQSTLASASTDTL